MFVFVWAAIALNVTAFDRHGALWARVKPVYGLAQRALFAAWFGWSAGAGLFLFQTGMEQPEVAFASN